MAGLKQIIKKSAHFIAPPGSEVYNWLYYHFYWKPDGEIGRFIQDYSKKKGKRKMKFIQVGANDGFTGDNIYWFIKYHQWSGILVEPIVYLFHKLKLTYRNFSQELFFENVAIADSDEPKDFYYIDNFEKDARYPEWLRQLGSFNKQQVEWVENGYPGLKLKTEKIKCTSLSNLVRKYNYFDLDFLYIDVEGYDFEIIKTIDFSILKPKLIYYEHRHLTPEDREASVKYLEGKSYNILKGEFDNLAILMDQSA